MSGVNKVLKDFKGRRIALINAFTSDFDDFYDQCDPEKANLMLYGHPNNKWELRYPLPAKVFPELPEPVIGINFARDGMKTKNWMSLVALHSDLWLLEVAFFFAAQIGLDKSDRERLFDKINNLPTLLEIVMTEFKDNEPKKKSKAKYQDMRRSSLKQALKDKIASRLNDLKLNNTVSQKQDLSLAIPAPESVVVRVVDGCTDLASDPAMRLVGPTTFRQAGPATR